MNIASGKRTLLDNGRGYHYPKLSEDGNAVMDNYSEPSVPRKYEIISLMVSHSVMITLQLLILGKDILFQNTQTVQ